VFVCCDAHLDLYDAYDGNPLARRRDETDPEDVDSVEEVILLASAPAAMPSGTAAADDVTVVPPADVSDWSLGTDSRTARST